MNKVPAFIFRFILGYLLTIGIIFAVQWTYYNYFDFYNIPSITEPITILNENNEIAIGDTIKMELHIKKPQEVASIGTVNITCNDGNLITMSPSPNRGTLPAGNHVVLSTSHKLPPKAAIGAKCQFNFINVYQVNPYKTEIRSWHSETFKVVER